MQSTHANRHTQVLHFAILLLEARSGDLYLHHEQSFTSNRSKSFNMFLLLS